MTAAAPLNVTRDPHPERPASKALRVMYVMRLMASGWWVKGVTGPELAEAWGLSEQSIEFDAAEASRRVKALTDPQWVRERLAETLNHAAEVARRDPREAAAVANAYAGLVGAAAPQRHDIRFEQHPAVLALCSRLRAACEAFDAAAERGSAVEMVLSVLGGAGGEDGGGAAIVVRERGET